MTEAQGESAPVRVGVRLKCQTCGSEAIVTIAGDPALECCGAPLSVIFEPAN
jgi:hypothetical protein